MSRLLAIFLVTFFALTSSVLAFSNGPGTCLVSGMKGTPHGSTPSKNVTVTVDVKLMSAGTYSITVGGTGAINGLLLYAVDANGTRFGAFSKPPTGFGPKTGCGGTNPAMNTLGHINPTPKTIPLTFTWSDDGYLAKTTLTASFAGIAMSNTEAVWYVLSGGDIPTASGNSTSAAASSGAPSSAPTPVTSIGNSSAAAPSAAASSAMNTSVFYGYGANSNSTSSTSSTTQAGWFLAVAAFSSVFATFLL